MRADPETTPPLPQREPLNIPVDVEGLPPELQDVVQTIKSAVENVLFRWKSFPITLPPPVAVVNDGDLETQKPLNIRDVFVVPSFDELDAVALDVKSEPRRLSPNQLQSVKERGEFEVESLNFPSQVHKWRLSKLLQKGTQRAHQSLLNDTALALRFVLITSKNRIHSPFFSLSQSVMALFYGILQLIDLLFGMPSLFAGDLDAKIKEERCKYLVAEMVVKPEFEEQLDYLCLFIKQQINKQKLEKYHLDQEKLPPVPLLYQTPRGIDIDLRLYNRELMKKVLPFLSAIVEKEARGWFLHFREKTVAELKGKNLGDEEIEKLANMAIMDEYLRRVYSSIIINHKIEELGPGIGQLLADHAQSVIMMYRAMEAVQDKLNRSETELRHQLRATHPVLSRIGPWLDDKLRQAEEQMVQGIKWEAHERALNLCREQHIEQAVYFIHRDLTFMREREPVLMKELSRVRKPTRLFTWRLPIWFPRHWVVRRVFQGESEVIPTLVSKSSTGLSVSRADPNEPVFLVDKQITRITTTRWPFWRWNNYFHRTWAWVWNAMFIFGVVIPWCSPVSFKALFSVEPFTPDLEPDISGTLVPRKSMSTQTLCSRLLTLWRHISKSRTEFETRPDTGFIGKGLTRHANRLWNYCIKGLGGTLAITVVFPIVCIIFSFFSVVIAFTTPVWMPLATLGFHLMCILVYNFDATVPSDNRWVVLFEAILWKIVVCGVLQPVLALFVGFIVCPVICFSILLFGVARRSGRCLWDNMLFHLVIKHRGRVPTSDSLVARRVAGPGLASNYFYQICPEQAIAAFETRLELDELTAFRDETEKMINQPLRAYGQFAEACFKPFSASVVHEGFYLKLEKEAQELVNNLKESVDRRKRELQTGLNVGVRSRIKMHSRDLKVAMKQCAVLLEKFYPSRVLSRLPISEDKFWETKGSSFRDWAGLTALMLSEVFSQEFLIPLEESDVRFCLEVNQVSLHRYTEMLRVTEARDDLDVISTVHTPKSNVQLHSPYLDVTTFNPIWKRAVTGHQALEKRRSLVPWKRAHRRFSPEKLPIPLPIPSPANVAVIVHNRETEDPIPQESDICQVILKVLDDNSLLGGATGTAVSAFCFGHDTTPSPTPTPPTEHHRCTQVNLKDEADIEVSVVEVFEPDIGGSIASQSNRNSGSVVVNLASSEDITLEPDGDRVTYSHGSYSTTV